MKYIIDIDALKECLSLLPTSTHSPEYVDIKIVNKMIDSFPKEKYGGEYVDTLKKIINYNTEVTCAANPCAICVHDGWDWPECKDCNSENNYKYYTEFKNI